MSKKINKDHFRGCVLGGAVADAKSVALRDGGRDLISDNTQLAFFTIDGLLWADARAKRKGVYAYIPCLFYSYQKWYYSQTGSLADEKYSFILEGEILQWEKLFARRGEGLSTLYALRDSINGKYATISSPMNQNNSCGAINRSAPIGMYFVDNPSQAFAVAADAAALTHGNINAIYSSAFMATMIACILSGKKLSDAIDDSLDILHDEADVREVEDAIKKAVNLTHLSENYMTLLSEIGEGYESQEALAIAVFIVLSSKNDYEKALKLAISYGGNTDSILPIIGSIMGANLGLNAIPKSSIKKLELAELAVYGTDQVLTHVNERIRHEKKMVKTSKD